MVRHLAGRYPLLLALVAQLGACLGVAVLLYLGAQLSAWRPSALAAALLQGLLAAGLARGLGLSRWWGWLNLGFVPGLVLASGAALPSWVFLLGFALLVLLNWNSIGERVPLYLTGAQTRKELMALLAQQAPDFRFVDLGCGPAGSLLSLARQFPRAQFVGVETAPLSTPTNCARGNNSTATPRHAPSCATSASNSGYRPAKCRTIHLSRHCAMMGRSLAPLRAERVARAK